MSSPLESLPLELLRNILDLVDLTSTCLLRLSSRTLAVKCSWSPDFRTRFHAKDVVLTEPVLKSLAESLQGGGLCALVQEVRISGDAVGEWPRDIAAWKARQLASRRNQIFLLSQAFEGIARNGATGRLPSLLLESAKRPKDGVRGAPGSRGVRYDWKLIPLADADTVDIVFHALGESRLQIEALAMFSEDEYPWKSGPRNALDLINLEDSGLSRSLAMVRSLSMRLKQHLPTTGCVHGGGRPVEREQPPGPGTPVSLAEGDTPSLARFLNLFGSLGDVDLRYLRQVCHEAPTLPARADFAHYRLLSDIFRSNRLPNATRCELRGIFTGEADLLGFLKRTSLSELILEDVFLTSGSFRTIFDYCTSDAAASLIRLDCDALYESDMDRRVVGFLGHGRGLSRLAHMAPSAGHVSLERRGDDVRVPISYTRLSYPTDAPAARQWRTMQFRMYNAA